LEREKRRQAQGVSSGDVPLTPEKEAALITSAETTSSKRKRDNEEDTEEQSRNQKKTKVEGEGEKQQHKQGTKRANSGQVIERPAKKGKVEPSTTTTTSIDEVAEPAKKRGGKRGPRDKKGLPKEERKALKAAGLLNKPKWKGQKPPGKGKKKAAKKKKDDGKRSK